MNTQKSLIAITSLTATFVALCAAIFSVTGIAKLFAGAALSAGVMAAALELGKIVSISFLYQYWKEIPKTLKYYLSTAAVILMVITSAGIYGYLSSAYAKVAATPLQLNADIKTVEGRIKSVEQDIQRKNDRLTQLITLRNQQETRLDNMVSKSTTGSNSTIRSAQNALNQADRNVTQIQKEISELSAVRDSLRGVTIGKQVEIETNGDIGTFVYIAKVFNTNLDTVVKWFTLVIVFVFDPLAVALVIAVNFLIKNTHKKETTENIEKPQEPEKKLIELNEEPYKIYTTQIQSKSEIYEEPTIQVLPTVEKITDEELEEKILSKYLDANGNGIPDWMESSFNWDDTSKWINNPIAKLYKQKVIDKK